MRNPSPEARFSGIVLAGDRGPCDPLLRTAAASCKALLPVGGTGMVFRVLEALEQSRSVGRCLLVGPSREKLDAAPDLCAEIREGRLGWMESGPTPSTSASAALSALTDDRPVLLTTADHALLTAEMVDFFSDRALASGRDVVAGVARYETVTAAFPGCRRTVTRLQDGNFCGCNLFAFLTPRAREAASFWRRLESLRKKPWRLMGAVGWGVVLRYILGRLGLREGLEQLSAKMGVAAAVVEMPFPEAAVDVDKPSDLDLAEEVLRRRRGGPEAASAPGPT